MKKRFASKQADVTNSARMQDLERGIEAVRVQPAQLLARDLAIGEIAEVASRVAGIGNRNVAQSGTALTNEMQHIA